MDTRAVESGRAVAARATERGIWKTSAAYQRRVLRRETDEERRREATVRLRHAQSGRRRQQHPPGRQGDVRTVTITSSHDEDPAHCTICQRQPHQYEDCRDVWRMSVARRREEVRRLNLCFACLRPGHSAFNCEANCAACGERHHVMLHEMGDDATYNTPLAPAPLPSRPISIPPQPTTGLPRGQQRPRP